MKNPLQHWIVVALATGAIVLSTPRAHADPASDQGLDGPWGDFWNDCYDLNLPYFQAKVKKFQSLLGDGKGWDSDAEVEKVNVDLVMNETCKKWAADPNGDAPLREFITKFGGVASKAVDIKGKIVTEIAPQMDAWWAVEEKELAPYGFKFEEFPCGKAFKKMEAHIADQLGTIEAKFDLLKEKCPKAADELIAAARAKGPDMSKLKYGQGRGKVVKGKSKNGASDITGVKDDQAKEQKSEDILNQQDQKAKEENQKKSQGQ